MLGCELTAAPLIGIIWWEPSLEEGIAKAMWGRGRNLSCKVGGGLPKAGCVSGQLFLSFQKTCSNVAAHTASGWQHQVPTCSAVLFPSILRAFRRPGIETLQLPRVTGLVVKMLDGTEQPLSSLNLQETEKCMTAIKGEDAYGNEGSDVCVHATCAGGGLSVLPVTMQAKSARKAERKKQTSGPLLITICI